jgi:GNAT superfamily N-acetyltransferase
MIISIRKCDHEDGLLRELHSIVMPSDTQPDWGRGVWWLAHDDAGEPVGFAGMQRSSRWGDTWYLCRAGVVRKARGNGLQRRLIRVRSNAASKAGANWLITETLNNPPSANSLIAEGFRMYLPTEPWATDESQYWRKRLNTGSAK